jgi:hypothetical protein
LVVVDSRVVVLCSSGLRESYIRCCCCC